MWNTRRLLACIVHTAESQSEVVLLCLTDAERGFRLIIKIFGRKIDRDGF